MCRIVLWEPLDTGVAQVAMDGSVVAVSNGQARIVAISFSGVTDTVLVIVDAPPADGESDGAGITADASTVGAAWESHPSLPTLPEGRVRLVSRSPI